MKTLIILRGLPGSGNSTLVGNLKDPVICSADHFFKKSGEYKFNARYLGAAHGECKDKFKNAILNEEELIVIDNTNTTYGEYKYYLDYGNKNNYIVIEVNESPMISMHHIPYEGKSINAAAAIIDQLFPETKGKKNDKSN